MKEKIGDNQYQVIFAKEGKVMKNKNQNSLLLFNGKIINSNNQETNSFEVSSTEFNLSKFETKTTTHPKLQEVKTYEILNCIVRLKSFPNIFIFNIFKTNKKLDNCSMNNLNESFQEIFKRFIAPFYLPILSLIACLIIIKSKDDYKHERYKFLLFLLGVITIIISEISTKYSSSDISSNIYLISLPILFFFITYAYFKLKLKKSNLLNQWSLTLIKNIF